MFMLESFKAVEIISSADGKPLLHLATKALMWQDGQREIMLIGARDSIPDQVDIDDRVSMTTYIGSYVYGEMTDDQMLLELSGSQQSDGYVFYRAPGGDPCFGFTLRKKAEPGVTFPLDYRSNLILLMMIRHARLICEHVR
jgi:hypothetical protein